MSASFDALLKDTGPCLSILLPLDHSAGRGRDAGTRLRALLREAAEQAKTGAQPAETPALLAAWSSVIDDADFWKHPGEGVALLSSPHMSTALWLTEPVRQGFRVAPSFALLALLRLRQRRPFYVLALSRKRCRLLHWDGRSATVVKVEGMPENVEAAVGMAQPRELQSHTTGRGHQRMMHGGEAGQDEKSELRTYLLRVDAALRPRLQADSGAPLVVAGVEALIALYHGLSQLPQLLPGGLTGNFDRSSGRVLCGLARPLVERAAISGLPGELERFAELFRSGLAVTDTGRLREAAASGGVDTLFVPDPGSVGLLSEDVEGMAVDVLRRGGAVHLVPSWEMPGGVDGVGVAGILRHGRAA